MRTTMGNFNELTVIRKELQEKCKKHFYSLNTFKIDNGISFKINLCEKLNRNHYLDNITTTATCIESLLEIPEIFLPKNNNDKSDIINLTNDFIEKALQPGSNKWESEGSAKIYSRCRALPLIISNTKWVSGKFIYKNSNNGNKDFKIDDYIIIHYLISDILLQLESENRKAIGEYQYPENAYHTFYIQDLIVIEHGIFCGTHRTYLGTIREPMITIPWI